MAKRSGTETRKRMKLRTMRFSAAEDEAIAKMASASGCSFAELVRHALFTAPPPRAARRHRADDQAVARLMGELAKLKAEAGKHGSNLNQIAHYLNAGRPLSRIEKGLEDALDAVTTFYERDMAELRLACMQALGFELGRDDDDGGDTEDVPPPPV